VQKSAEGFFAFSPQISWVRKRDWTILTNGVFTITSDDRFSVRHSEGSFDWVLQIKFVQERDKGLYECQVGLWECVEGEENFQLFAANDEVGVGGCNLS